MSVTCAVCVVSVKRLELQEALMGKIKVQHIQMSRLRRYMRPDSPVYLLATVHVACSVREGKRLPSPTPNSLLLVSPLSPDNAFNAVWDHRLGLCFGVLECNCGHVVGVKVHAAQGPDDALLNLINKVRVHHYFVILLTPFILYRPCSQPRRPK